MIGCRWTRASRPEQLPDARFEAPLRAELSGGSADKGAGGQGCQPFAWLGCRPLVRDRSEATMSHPFTSVP